MIRQGECNRCGQCCGAPGSPERDSPWPDTYPEAVRNWTIASIEKNCPIFKLVGHPSLGAPTAAAFRVANKTYRAIWKPGHGLCADAPPWGDDKSFEEMCPFLMPQQPDGTHPCALVGTQWEYIWEKMCKPSPPMEMSEEDVKTWQRRHPKCSYEWV